MKIIVFLISIASAQASFANSHLAKKKTVYINFGAGDSKGAKDKSFGNRQVAAGEASEVSLRHAADLKNQVDQPIPEDAY